MSESLSSLFPRSELFFLFSSSILSLGLLPCRTAHQAHLSALPSLIHLLEPLHTASYPSSVKFGGLKRDRLLETTPGRAFSCFATSRKHHEILGFTLDLTEEGDTNLRSKWESRDTTLQCLATAVLMRPEAIVALLRVRRATGRHDGE
jgi:hypothetical protein